MTTKPASQQFIGKTAIFHIGQSLQFLVTIQDHKVNFGRDDVLVTPVSGNGSKWVSAESLTIEPDPEKPEAA